MYSHSSLSLCRPAAMPISSLLDAASPLISVPSTSPTIATLPIPSQIAPVNSIAPDMVSSMPRSRSINVGQRVSMENSITSIPAIPTPTTQMSFSLSTDQRRCVTRAPALLQRGDGCRFLRSSLLANDGPDQGNDDEYQPIYRERPPPTFVQPYLQIRRQQKGNHCRGAVGGVNQTVHQHDLPSREPLGGQ